MHSSDEERDDDADWASEEFASDPRRAYDTLVAGHPVAWNAKDRSWMVTGHAEVRRCALDPGTFSNATSSRLQIPNGLDGERHRHFRALIDRFFRPERITPLAPLFRQIAEDLVRALPRDAAVEVVWDLGARLSIRCQCAWLGWPPALEPRLLRWMEDYRAAMRGPDVARRARVAEEFGALVLEQLEARRQVQAPATADVTAELLGCAVEDPLSAGGRRALTDSEIVSILRNWTAGDLGTIAACVGVMVARIAVDAALQSRLRASVEQAVVLERAIDECLRIDDPFLWNRRVTTRDVEIGGRVLESGSKVILNWTAANRDPRRFDAPDDFRADDNAAHNLVYGIGPHVCPGRGLATLQLRELLAALLRRCPSIRAANRPAERATAPSGGYDRVWVVLAGEPG